MRVFLGLRGSDLESRCLDQVCRDNQVKAAHQPSDRHMTLCFLGECSTEQQGRLIEALDESFVQSPSQAVVWHGERLERFPDDCHNTDLHSASWAWQGGISESLQLLINRLQGIPWLSDYRCFEDFQPHISLAYLVQGHYGYLLFSRAITLTQLVLYGSLSEELRDSSQVEGDWAAPRYQQLNVWELKNKENEGETGLP